MELQILNSILIAWNSNTAILEEIRNDLDCGRQLTEAQKFFLRNHLSVNQQSKLINEGISI